MTRPLWLDLTEAVFVCCGFALIGFLWGMAL